MSDLAPAQVISLDVDGTLYRVRRLTVAWRLRTDRGLLVAMVAAREKIRHEGPFADLNALHRREAELVAPSFELSMQEAETRLASLRDLLPAALTERIRAFRGVRGALEAAHARGLKLAVLSDYDAREKLEHLGLADLPWQAYVSAEACGALKPHALPFEALVRELAVPASEIVHVGDREDIDVAGALAAGLRAWRFSPKGKTVTAAEHHLQSYKLDAFAPLWPADSSAG